MLRRNLLPSLRTPLSSVPRTDWLIVVAYGAVALAIGLGTDLLHLEFPSLFELLVLPALLLIYPCLIEESIFRGLLLPRSLMTATRLRQGLALTVSTALFVIMHPLNAWLVGLSDTSQFLEPPFLIIVTLLGYTCGYVYLRSGSLWAPIAVHWATVVAWNLFLGRDFAV